MITLDLKGAGRRSSDNISASDFAKPINHEIIAILAQSATNAIKCAASPKTRLFLSMYSEAETCMPLMLTKELPTLEQFITALCQHTGVQINHLFCAFLYVERLRCRLPSTTSGISSSRHAIFLASLIVATKYLDDAPPSNSSWPAYTLGLFPLSRVNMMEKEILFLLGWELYVTATEIHNAVDHYFRTIRKRFSFNVSVRPAEF